MEVNIIKGDENAGKSTVCLILFKELIKNGAEVIFSPRPNEYKETVKILKYNKKIIAISSIGDSKKLIKDNLNKLLNYDLGDNKTIDYLFITSRNTKDFLDCINDCLINQPTCSYKEFLLNKNSFRTADDFLNDKISFLIKEMSIERLVNIKISSMEDLKKDIRFKIHKINHPNWI